MKESANVKTDLKTLCCLKNREVWNEKNEQSYRGKCGMSLNTSKDD